LPLEREIRLVESFESDPSGVLSVLRDLSEAIAAKDVEAVLAAFSESDGVTMFGSEGPEVAYGRGDLEALWSRVLSRDQQYLWRWREERVLIAGDVAWLSAKAEVSIDGGSDRRELPYRVTLVLTLHSGRWLIEQYHGSEPADVW
jgi:ketosteroid isomerase-like protein